MANDDTVTVHINKRQAAALLAAANRGLTDDDGVHEPLHKGSLRAGADRLGDAVKGR